MNSIERYSAVNRQQRPDKIPLRISNYNMFMCKYYGITVREYLDDPALNAEIFVTLVEDFKFDSVTPGLGYILYGCGPEMGSHWQFTEDEMSDSQPEMYWSEDEQRLGDDIISTAARDSDFGCILVSDRFGTQLGKHHQESYDKDTRVMTKILIENEIPYFYWMSKPMSDTPFDFIEKALDMKHIDLRIQLYMKSKAKINISNQCGTNHLMVRYSKCYESQRQYPISHNFVEGETYL